MVVMLAGQIAIRSRMHPATLAAQNWLWGNASREATNVYNPTNFPDVYFLIDEDGIIRAIDGAPSATLDKIIKFSQKQE